MEGIDFIIIGVLLNIYTVISEYVFNFTVNAIGMSVGLLLGGIIITFYEKIFLKNEKQKKLRGE